VRVAFTGFMGAGVKGEKTSQYANEKRILQRPCLYGNIDFPLSLLTPHPQSFSPLRGEGSALVRIMFSRATGFVGTSGKWHHTKNGLCAFSSATVVNGPWPGQISVSGGSEKICSRTFCFARSHD